MTVPLRPALPVPSAPWVRQVFGARAAQRGGVVRRSARWVEREVGRAIFEAEVRRRGFHLIETGGQLIVICNGGGLRVIC
ncbi:N-(5'-phosphoribosyl)anthranilate isomerase [Jannaschia ovalis]|uniref:N-(5'-phosphoribosyl)anthranilate isomerase n=1 Tax=Jannaschia ovalis TaxID=3038773 RepID=A0ABY8LBS9_9RHOB|nr:N-(5'-phosphoribosyl)anthranilate isomerase [Jannaschia sp. GRR-S6-38]WGH78789.1 N-(5'-phosphoribosyl)anthranilate isomerase [Jannaschia sp. GRR-S6-38]